MEIANPKKNNKMSKSSPQQEIHPLNTKYQMNSMMYQSQVMQENVTPKEIQMEENPPVVLPDENEQIYLIIENAATLIQKTWRMWFTRKVVKFYVQMQ